MKLIKPAAIVAALGVALAGVAIATPAYADPVSNSYVLVGSDTLQDAGNALSNGTFASGASVRVVSSAGSIASFDAFGSAAIQTKPNGVYFARPAGSGDGAKALSRSIDGSNFSVSGNLTAAKAITGQVDIARSSSGPASPNASGVLAYIPFGRDAVSYAYKLASGVTAPAGIEALTSAQLTAIYNGTQTTVGGVTVVPKLPQNGSGTRKFWLSAIGVSTPSGVTDAATTTLQENNASDASFAPAAGTIQIVPFSAASWIAQSNGVTGVNTITGSGALLGAIDGNAAYSGTGSSLAANSAAYASTTYGRDTYVVVENARITTGDPKFDQGLADLVDRTKAKSLTNFGTLSGTSGAVKTKFGFLAPSSTTIQRANAQ